MCFLFFLAASGVYLVNSAGMYSMIIRMMMRTETIPQAIPTFFWCFFENIIKIGC